MRYLVKSSLLALAVLCCACKSEVDITPEDALKLSETGAEMKPQGSSKMEVNGNDFHFISNGNHSSGVLLDKDWDLTGFSGMRFTVANRSDRTMQIVVQLQEEYNVRVHNPVTGVQMHKYTLFPGETRNLEMHFVPQLPHPEVADQLYSMRCDPYSRYTQNYCYRADLAKIKRLSIIANKTYTQVEWDLLNPVLIPAPENWAEDAIPEPMKLDSASFFPFIDKYGQLKYIDWPGKTYSDADLKKAAVTEAKDLRKHPGAKDWSRFGGWAAGPRLAATGHFRVQKLEGKWWMVDPEGYLFWSNGIVRVTPSCAITPLHGEKIPDRTFYFEDLPAEGTAFAQFYRTHDALLKPYYTARNIDSTYDFSSANAYRKYGPDYREIYADLAHRRLRSWGFNTIANSSDKDICLMDRTAYTDRFEIYSKPLVGTSGWKPFMDPFDPSFMESLEEQFVSRETECKDPWCLGMFVDNEIQWGNETYITEKTLQAPADQACKLALLDFLKDRYGNIAALNSEWGTQFRSWEALLANRGAVTVNDANREILHEFNRSIIRKYYSTIREAFDKFAPGLMYMGCRFAGLPSNKDILTIGAEYCDIISMNSYRYDFQDYEPGYGLDKPVMIGEFHFGSQDRGMLHASLVDVENQPNRGRAFYDYVKSALENPYIIGVHWHQFSDQATTGRFDGENLHVGFTDVCDTPYYETIEGARKIGYKMYSVRKPVAALQPTPLDSLELKYAPGLKVGDVAPDFAAPDSLGQEYKLSDYKGKYVVLDFWASWCRDCRNEIPHVKALYEDFKGVKIGRSDIEFLSVSFDHKEDAWKSCIASEGFPWPQVCNLIKWKENPISVAYDLHWIPSFYIVNPEGKVVATAINSARLREQLTILSAR